MKIQAIERKELKNRIGKPVWYQCLTDINDFGWAFIHPETVKLQPGGYPLGYCKLIKPDPKEKDFYSWDAIRLYSRPAFHGICHYCDKRHEGQLTHCEALEQGKECRFGNKYREFKVKPPYDSWGYSVKTFLEMIRVSGVQIRNQE